MLRFPFAVPSNPYNLSAQEVTSTTIKLSWHVPDEPNGRLDGYRIYYIHQNQTSIASLLKADAGPGPEILYVLPNLSKLDIMHTFGIIVIYRSGN